MRTNFYSRWTDDQMNGVIIPLMGCMSLPKLDLDTLRSFDNKDAESLFMMMSYPMDTLLSKFDIAVRVYEALKDGRDDHSVQFLIDACRTHNNPIEQVASVVWKHWSELLAIVGSTHEGAQRIIEDGANTTSNRSAYMHYVADLFNFKDERKVNKVEDAVDGKIAATTEFDQVPNKIIMPCRFDNEEDKHL